MLHPSRSVGRTSLRVKAALLWVLGLASVLCLSAQEPATKSLSADQQARLKERDRLSTEANNLRQAGKLPETIAAVEKMLAIEREVYGLNEDVASTLELLAELNEAHDDLVRARERRQEAFATRLKMHGERHWRVADVRLALARIEQLAALAPKQRQELAAARAGMVHAVALFKMNQFKEAFDGVREFQETHQRLLGAMHPEYAASLHNLGRLNQVREDLPQAEKLYLQALALRLRLLGEDHPDYGASLNDLGLLCHARGDYVQAEKLIREASAVWKRTLGDTHPTFALSLNNLAGLDQIMGYFGRAETRMRATLALRRKILGEEHPDYAESLRALATLLHAMGDLVEAEAHFDRALAIQRRHHGDKHLDCALTLQNLGSLYYSKGDYDRAETHWREALEIRRAILGEQHSVTVATLGNLSVLYQTVGDYAQAEPILRLALEARKTSLGANHPSFAITLKNLAHLHVKRREYAKAEALLEQARDIARKHFGERHPEYASCLSLLANVYHLQEDYERARPLEEKVYQLRRELLGERHPDFALTLNGLAINSARRGDHQRAAALLEQAVRTQREVVGTRHVEYGRYVQNLGMLHYLTGERDRSTALVKDSLEVFERLLSDHFVFQSERQRLRYLSKLRSALDCYLSVGLAAGTPAADLYAHVLAWKGAVAGRQSEERLVCDQPELRELAARLAQARARLAQRGLAVPPPRQAEGWTREVAELRQQKEALESELARRSEVFRRDQEALLLSPRLLAEALPARTAFLDFLEFTHFDPPPGGKGPFRVERRLLAFVTSRDRAPTYVSLEASAPIVNAVERWRQALRENDMPALTATAADLRQRVWQPIQPHLAGAQTVLVAPDGALSQFPLAALPGSRPGTYLIEEVAVGYGTSGRHIREAWAAPVAAGGRGLLAIGGVEYLGARPASSDSAAALTSGPEAHGRDRMSLPYLPGTEPEARRCLQLFQRSFARDGALILAGADPHEGRIKQELAAAPRFLHLATHGVFDPPTRAADVGAELGDEGRSRAVDLWATETAALTPLLRSGLALAGAGQQRKPPAAAEEDGILTAEEVAAFDLRGTELVVLSACETGLGTIEKGEGVLGLQRAFQAAGARTTITSLWSINDAATSVLMEEFYANLWQKKLSKIEALRQAQLMVLRNPGRVQQRTQELRELLVKRGIAEPTLAARGIGKEATDLPAVRETLPADRRSPPAWWAAFVLSGDGR